MFILMCGGHQINIYEVDKVDYMAKMMVDKYACDCTIDQYDNYLGDSKPQHHFLGAVRATLH